MRVNEREDLMHFGKEYLPLVLLQLVSDYLRTKEEAEQQRKEFDLFRTQMVEAEMQTPEVQESSDEEDAESDDDFCKGARPGVSD